MVISPARNTSAFRTWKISTWIGLMSATIPKNSNNSIISDPSKSPSPMAACARNNDLISTAKSGIVVPIPIIVIAIKYAGMW